MRGRRFGRNDVPASVASEPVHRRLDRIRFRGAERTGGGRLRSVQPRNTRILFWPCSATLVRWKPTRRGGSCCRPPSITHAGLTENVMFIGTRNNFQIWEPDAGARRSAEAREKTQGRRSCTAAGGRCRHERPRVRGHVPVMLDEVLATLAPRDGGCLPRRNLRRRRLCAGHPGTGALARCGRSIATQRRSSGAPAWWRVFPAGCICCTGSSATWSRCWTQAGVTALDGIVLDLGVSSFQIDDPAAGLLVPPRWPARYAHGKTWDECRRSGEHAARTRPWRTCCSNLGKSGRPAASPMPSSRPGWRHRSKPPAGWPRSSVRCCRRIVRATIPRPEAFRRFGSRSTTNCSRSRPRWSSPLRLLSPGGRLVVVAFHSLEDRIVKRFMTRGRRTRRVTVPP